MSHSVTNSMMRKDILLIGDKPDGCKYLSEDLRRKGYDVDTVAGSRRSIALLTGCYYKLVIADIYLSSLSAHQVLEEVKSYSSHTRVILVRTEGDKHEAVATQKKGAYDHITLPLTINEVLKFIPRYLANDPLYLSPHPKKVVKRFGKIIGRSKKMQKIFTLIERVAPTDATVFISGDTGTGKELVADEIQKRSKRCDKPFVRVNCSAIPEALMESELFGHEKGSFTGAIKQHKGRFEIAEGGTILLDEITEMPLHLQAKLLRVLQTGEIQRVGSEETLCPDVRVIAISNRNIEKEIENRRFREDLYYRLNVVSISLPPLSNRAEDIPILAEHFLAANGKKYGREKIRFRPEALSVLSQLPFPGNVRQLENIIERVVVISRSGVIRKNDILACVKERKVSYELNGRNYAGTIKEVIRELTLQTLQDCNYSRKYTAAALGISERTLRYKLSGYRQEGYADA